MLQLLLVECIFSFQFILTLQTIAQQSLGCLNVLSAKFALFCGECVQDLVLILLDSGNSPFYLLLWKKKRRALIWKLRSFGYRIHTDLVRKCLEGLLRNCLRCAKIATRERRQSSVFRCFSCLENWLGQLEAARPCLFVQHFLYKLLSFIYLLAELLQLLSFYLLSSGSLCADSYISSFGQYFVTLIARGIYWTNI